MERMILVLGGTGLLGAPVARRLHRDGFRVRVLSRDPASAPADFPPSIERVAGDARDTATLQAALEGCWGAHLSVAGPAEGPVAAYVARLAGALGLSRVGYVSGSSVTEANRWFPMIDEKWRAETAVAGAGVPWTIFRPTWPFETLERFVRDGRATAIGAHPTPYHWFAADDFARMVSAAYRSDEAAGRRLWIHGPEAILLREALDRYRQALHPEIDATSAMPAWMARALGVVTRNAPLRAAAELMAYFDRVGEPGDPAEANRMLGAPATTLDAWLQARRQARAAPAS